MFARATASADLAKTPEANGGALDVHHLQPFRFSGDNSPDNLLALCRSCHMRADDHGRAGSARFLQKPKGPTKREIRRLRALIRSAEARARRRQQQFQSLEMHAAGKSLREIARATAASHQTIANWIGGLYIVREPAQRYTVRPHRPRARPCYPVRLPAR